MSNQPGSTRLHALFDSALQEYEKNAGVEFAQHPLAFQLQNCDSIDSVIIVLQGQVDAFRGIQRSNEVMESIKNTVLILTKISATKYLGDTTGLSVTPAQAILVGLAILLAAANGATANYEPLVELLKSIEHFLNRLDIYTRMLSTPIMDEIVVKIIVVLLSTLGLATKEFKRGRSIKFVKNVPGEKDIEAVLHRLDRLTIDEARTTAAQTLEVVHGLVQNMRVTKDAPIDRVREALEILHQVASDLDKLKRDELRQNIRNWISPPDLWKNHHIAHESHYEGTAGTLPDSAEHNDSYETQEVLDYPTLTLDEAVQVIHDLWEAGLKDTIRFRVLMSLMKELLAESAGGEAKRNALEDTEQIPILIESKDAGSSLDSFRGSLDTSSMVSDEYTVRSITSIKERTSWFYRPRDKTGARGL